MSTPYRVDLDDIHFVWFEQLEAHDHYQQIPKYEDLDRDIFEATIAEGSRIAREVLHPINRAGDLEGCHFDGKGNVRTPKGYKEAWDQFRKGGWIAPSAPIEFGGGGLPKLIAMTLNDMFMGAATAFLMYPGLTAAAGRMVMKFAPEDMRTLVATKLFSGDWGGTMCLTESGAGSSVGDNRAKATPTDEEGVYLLEGEKIFISAGDQDLSENIIHLVLGRTPGSPEGTKGLSLFLVPKFMFDKGGKSGERNGAKVVGVEHKMGLHGSATCTLALGSDMPCKGWLLGEERRGISLMFHMMNEARIGVATQGESVGVAAYAYAVQYARERVQGTSLRDFKRDDEAPRVAIIEHPDVRRMLMTLKVNAETMRSACFKFAFLADLAEHSEDEDERKRARDRIELLTPVLKGHCTDVGFEMAALAVQVYGGYGYIAEFPVEQLLRDAKIQSIYEGTNGIQALDLLGRKMRLEGGALFMRWMEEAQHDLKAAADEGFAPQSEALGKSVAQLGASAMHLGGLAGAGKIEGAFLYATPFLRAFGTVLMGLEALDQARVAKRLIAERGDSVRLRGKLLGLDFYIANLLPQATALAKSIQSGDDSPLDDQAFA